MKEIKDLTLQEILEKDNWIPITRATEIPSEKQEKCVVSEIEDVEDGFLPNILKEKPEWCPLILL